MTHQDLAIEAQRPSPLRALVRPAVALFVLLTLATGLVYPLAVTGLARLAFPHQAAGSLLVRDGRLVGSSLIGQDFIDPKHFWGRPSATAPRPYDAGHSGGSNLGPLNPALVEAVQQRIARLQAGDPGSREPVPIDLVTASASGLDPDISVAAARYQAARVARARGVPREAVDALIARHASGRLLGVLGEARVNVLELNLELDHGAARAAATAWAGTGEKR